MSTKVESTLAQLSAIFAVRDVMTDYKDLNLVNNELEAQRFFEEYDDYDYTAAPASGQITSYFRRGEPGAKPVRPENLISDGTNLLTLIDLLAERDFFFVLSRNEICGFVHFSDLNNELVKLPLYVLTQAIERHLWFAIEAKVTEVDLLKVLKEERFERVQQELEQAKRERVDRGWEGLLYFSDILNLARHFGLARLPSKDRSRLINIRNKVAHNDGRLLVEKQKDVRNLARVRELYSELLDTKVPHTA